MKSAWLPATKKRSRLNTSGEIILSACAR
ncbi:MAG TPA: hypothetical protein DEA38_05780 [Stenotrophomonas sp.]|nr:hypothetical protein [Stenotrophomonas sp.]